MGKNTLQKVRPGQPFRPSAGQTNTIVDAVAQFLSGSTANEFLIPGFTFKYFRITDGSALSVVSESDLAQWVYTGDEVVPIKFDPDNPHQDRYAPKAGGLTAVTLYNDCEERDPAYSDNQFITNSLPSYGNGVVVADLPEGMRISHIPIGRVVRAYYTLVAGGAEWRFDSPNGINGACTLEEGSGASGS